MGKKGTGFKATLLKAKAWSCCLKANIMTYIIIYVQNMEELPMRNYCMNKTGVQLFLKWNVCVWCADEVWWRGVQQQFSNATHIESHQVRSRPSSADWHDEPWSSVSCRTCCWYNCHIVYVFPPSTFTAATVVAGWYLLEYAAVWIFKCKDCKV